MIRIFLGCFLLFGILKAADPTGTLAGTVLDPGGCRSGSGQNHSDEYPDRTYPPDAKRSRWWFCVSSAAGRLL